MTARDRLSKFGKVVNIDQDPIVTIVRGAELHVIVQDQLFEIATLDIFEVKTAY